MQSDIFFTRIIGLPSSHIYIKRSDVATVRLLSPSLSYGMLTQNQWPYSPRQVTGSLYSHGDNKLLLSFDRVDFSSTLLGPDCADCVCAQYPSSSIYLG